MRKSLVVVALAPLLMACPVSPTKFVVDVGESEPSGGAFLMNGEATEMEWEDGALVVHGRKAADDDEASIAIRYPDGSEITCNLDDFEPTSGGTRNYRIDEGRCERS